MDDMFGGTPKYSTASDIYDALQELTQTEEMGILSDMGADVSWEGQSYYYTDAGVRLLERFEEISDCGEKLWLIDLAIFQMNQDDIHDTVYQALCNDSLAKRTSFKKVFIESVLGGSASQYKAVTESWESRLCEEGSFDFMTMCSTLNTSLKESGIDVSVQHYRHFCDSYYQKVLGLRLDEERQIVHECRALLTSYDDFMYGLRMNQALHDEQEKQYARKVEQLKAGYQAALEQIMLLADRHGIAGELAAELKMLGGGVK